MADEIDPAWVEKAAKAALTEQFKRILCAAGMEWEEGHLPLVQHLLKPALLAVLPKILRERDEALEALRDVRHVLTVPAAEYVPAIGDAFQIINALLAKLDTTNG